MAAHRHVELSETNSGNMGENTPGINKDTNCRAENILWFLCKISGAT